MSGSIIIHHQDTLEKHPSLALPDTHQDVYSKNVLGFWLYLMTDCLVFATLFSTYAVLRNNTAGGPSSSEIFDLRTAFAETMLLLFSSITCGFALLAATKSRTKEVIRWLAASFFLGASFVGMELHEFHTLAVEGNGWQRSAFLSSFFALVGTHGFHVSVGLLWMGVMMGQVAVMGVTADTFRRLIIFGLFWHFLDLVWVFIFTFVYLMGVM